MQWLNNGEVNGLGETMNLQKTIPELLFEEHASNVRNTSIEAYHELEAKGHAQTARARVLDYITRRPGCSDREIAMATGLTINCTTARRNELMKANLIMASKKILDTKTRMKVMTWRRTGEMGL